MLLAALLAVSLEGLLYLVLKIALIVFVIYLLLGLFGAIARPAFTTTRGQPAIWNVVYVIVIIVVLLFVFRGGIDL